MSKPDAKTTNPANLAQDARDEGYDEWVRAKIENALREADEFPERRIPIKQVWKKFGLEG
jgi:hypothetical protein